MTHQKEKNLLTNERGQVSIFLGIILLVIVSFIAFVINVGLFVKAKINLQNAVDAAAYSGAAVQARQLTNLGHLNWELRNTYKEWMFKYYVLGQVGLDATDNIDGFEPAPDTSIKLNDQGMNFRLRQFKGSNRQYYNSNVYDLYNLPSTCIHYGSSNNICEIVSIPGLPRFNTAGVPSISEQHESLLNSIVATKAEDCSSRSNVNQGAAMLWAYGTENSNLFEDVPLIAAGRTGAWVQAIEISMRMRNLERIMNEKPVDNFICINPGATSGKCTQSIQTLSESGKTYPFHERTVKAFYSAYRNLSGGATKDSRDPPVDFGTRFRMRELPPTPKVVDEGSLSGFLIPSDATGTPALSKYYVDLQLYPINLATFYTTFVSGSGSFQNSGTRSEADCGGTKTALPVPGYIVGYTKNPEVLTYYAVEGESDFVGLFYPFFNDEEGITLKTYAAAKPFGGRIGPALFEIKAGQSIEARSDNIFKLSSHYASAIDVSSLDASNFQAGYPIPIDPAFWMNNSSNITLGGNPTVSGNVHFAIPNLIYDFDNYSELDALDTASQSIQVLKGSTSDSLAYGRVDESAFGLYNINQFRKFAANKAVPSGSSMTNVDILNSIYNVRRPTKYEALNYLVPVMDFNGNNDLNTDQANKINPLSQSPAGDPGPNTRMYQLFAPLIGPDSLYPTAASVTNVIDGYINSNQAAVEKYDSALKLVADKMRDSSDTDTNSGDAYLAAADSIHQNGAVASDDPSSEVCRRMSMAQRFRAFFSTAGAFCGIIPIAEHVRVYFNEKLNNDAGWDNFYRSVYTKPDFNDVDLLTAYKPGPRQGATNDDLGGSPFASVSEGLRLVKRNSYSTKFIATGSVLSSRASFWTSLGVIAEGSASGQSFQSSEMFENLNVVNMIPDTELSDYGDLWF